MELEQLWSCSQRAVWSAIVCICCVPLIFCRVKAIAAAEDDREREREREAVIEWEIEIGSRAKAATPARPDALPKLIAKASLDSQL